MKTAVVLFNLGGPDSAQAIKPFLFNFFMDKNIIRLPHPFRFFIAALIAIRRSRKEAGTSYGLLGGASPLLKNTKAQAAELEQALGEGHRVFVSMRYWHPMADETIEAVKTYAPDRIILLPLYPQYSTTTTRSSFQTWTKAAKRTGMIAPTKLICCYPFEDGFIKSSAALVREAVDEATTKTGKTPRVLFSAHGLPEAVISDGDPYQWQCEESAKRIADQAGVKDWAICYQSRVGRMQWIGPSTEEELHRAALDKVPVVVYPHAFTQEHVETLVEIELEYRHKAQELGVPYFARVPTVATSPDFIAGLARLVRAAHDNPAIAPDGGRRICPEKFCRCSMQKGELAS